jgi:hypothetical protein
LDNRQDILGQVSSFQESQPERSCAQGGKAGGSTNAVQPFITVSQRFSAGDEQQARPGGSHAALQAAARHNK